MFKGSLTVTSETFSELFHVLCSLQMRKILRNHFGNALQNGLCISGKCGIVIFNKFVCKQFEGGCGITRKILVGKNCCVTHSPCI